MVDETTFMPNEGDKLMLALRPVVTRFPEILNCFNPNTGTSFVTALERDNSYDVLWRSIQSSLNDGISRNVLLREESKGALRRKKIHYVVLDGYRVDMNNAKGNSFRPLVLGKGATKIQALIDAFGNLYAGGLNALDRLEEYR